MTVLVGQGDRLLMAGGSLSSLKRSSVPFSMFGQGGYATALSGGRTVSYQQIYEEQQWVFTSVNKLSRVLSALPLHVYRITGDGAGGERERVREHPLVDCLRRPGPRRGPMYVKQKLMWPSLLHGNGVMAKVVEAPGAAPSGMVALDWRFLTPTFADDACTEVAFWTTTQAGDPMHLAPDQVVHMAWESGAGDIGVSPLKPLTSTIGIEDAAQRYQAASFNNGVRHSSVYVLPPDVELDTDERAELRAAISGQYGGVDKQFQMALVSGGGDIKPLSHTAVEAALIDQRKLDREEIAAVYDIPPPLIGILDKATYSNISVQAKMLYGMVLGPWLALMRETIQTQLVDAYEPWRQERLFVDFDLSDVLKGEPLAEVQAIREAIATGIMTPNEGRQARNLPPSTDPEADRLHMPTNNLTPMGAAPPADDPDAVVKGHLERVAYRVGRKGMDALDADRFRRELSEDTGNPDLAAEWTELLLAAPDERAIRALTNQ